MPAEKSSSYATPKAKRAKLSSGAGGVATPGRSPAGQSLQVPPTPCLKRLGFGTGVNVMLYERSPRGGVARSPWAIKKLRKRGELSGIAKRLEKEAVVLKGMSHPNIIGYRGFRRDESDGTLILAVENGQKALYDIMEEIRGVDDEAAADLDDDEDDEGSKAPPPEPLDPAHILTVVRGVANALNYLHNEKRLLHGDLKSPNVLIIGDFEEVKLCDFGVTVPLEDQVDRVPVSSEVQYIGTEPWSAPEVVEGSEITTKTDIFALGCTIFEMLTLETPHFNKLDLEDSKDVEDDEGMSAWDKAIGSRPDLPDYVEDYLADPEYEKVFALFYACTAKDPVLRPSAKDILDILDDKVELDTTTNEESAAADKIADESADKEADKPDDKSADKEADKSAVFEADKSADIEADKSADKSAAKKVDEAAEKPTNEADAKSDENEKPSDKEVADKSNGKAAIDVLIRL